MKLCYVIGGAMLSLGGATLVWAVATIRSIRTEEEKSQRQ